MPRKPRPPKWTAPRRVAVTLAVVAVVAVTTGAVAGGLSGRSRLRAPSAWAPAVAPLAGFVEAERGLRFAHPVDVVFMEATAFADLVGHGGADLTAHGPGAGADESGAYRALGLLEGGVDLLEAGAAAAGEAVLAYYDFRTRQVRVRGTELTLAVQGTLVHELTHALQDQAFDLSRHGTFASDAANDTFRALFEGDAVRMQDAWAASLGVRDRAAYQKARAAQSEDIDLGDVPEVLTTFLRAPYQFGPLFAQTVLRAKGQPALDAAFRSPPATDAQILDPFRFLEAEQVKAVRAPRLARDESETKKGAFGAMTLYLMLSQRLDAHQALAAADEWAGDAYVNFTWSGRQCVRAAFAGRDRSGTAVIEDALTAWERMMPSRAAVARRGAAVEVTTCDPGPQARSRGLNRLATAVAVPLARTRFALDAMAAGQPPAAARQAAAAFVAERSPAVLEAWLYHGAT